jgi:hypothetical protein
MCTQEQMTIAELMELAGRAGVAQIHYVVSNDRWFVTRGAATVAVSGKSLRQTLEEVGRPQAVAT